MSQKAAEVAADVWWAMLSGEGLGALSGIPGAGRETSVCVRLFGSILLSVGVRVRCGP